MNFLFFFIFCANTNSTNLYFKKNISVIDYQDKFNFTKDDIVFGNHNMSIYEIAFVLTALFNDNYEIIYDIISHNSEFDDLDYHILNKILNNLLMFFLNENLSTREEFFNLLNICLKDVKKVKTKSVDISNEIAIIVAKFMKDISMEGEDNMYNTWLKSDDFVKIFSIVLFKYILFFIHLTEIWNIKSIPHKELKEMLKQKYKN